MKQQSEMDMQSGQQQLKQSQQNQQQADMKISQKAKDFTTLEQVSNVALVGLINQLSSLSCQSEQLFNELHQQCEQFNERATLLTKRVTSLRNTVDKLDCKKVEPKPSLGELMGDLFLLTTSSSNDLLKWTTSIDHNDTTITTNNRLDNSNEEEEDHEELVRRIVTNAKIDDAITEKRRLCRQAALDTWLQDFKSSQAYHPFDSVGDDVISNGDDANRLLHNITIIDYDCNTIYDKLKHHHPTLNLFNFKNRPKTVKELYGQAERDTQAHINKLIRQHIALIRSSSNSKCTTSSSIRSSSPSSVSTIVRSASNSTTGGYNRLSSADYYSSSQLPARSKSARFLRPRFTLPITSRQPEVVVVDSAAITDNKLCNGHNQMPHQTHHDPSSSNQINSNTITKQPMVKSNSYCLTNKLNYCLNNNNNNNNNLSHNTEETDGGGNSGSNGAKPAAEAVKQCDINDLKQKQHKVVTHTTSDNDQDDDAEKISSITSCVDNHHHDHDEHDHQRRLDLNNKSTAMETDLDEQHDTIIESGQHYFSSLASNLDDSMRANNPSECSRSVTINTMDDCSATTKSTVTNYRSDSSIGAPYSSTATGISGTSSLRPTTTSCENNAASGTFAATSDKNQKIKLEQQVSNETNTKQATTGFKSLTLLRNIVKRASFRRSSTSSSSQQRQQQQSNLSTNDESSSLVTASSRDCSRSMASLQLPSPEEKLVQLSDQFKPKFVPIDVDTMFMRCNSSRRSLLHADFKIKRSKSQASDHSCNDRSHRNSSRRQSKRDNKINFDDSRHQLSSHRNRGSQVAWQTLNRLKMSKSEHRVNEVSVQTDFQSNGNNATITDSEKNVSDSRVKEDDNSTRIDRNRRPASVANCNIIVREHSSTQYDNNENQQKQPKQQQFNTADANTNEGEADINDAGNSSSGNWSESSPTTSESDRIKRQQKIDTINQENDNNNKIVIKNSKASATTKTIHSLPDDDLDKSQSTGGYNNHANYNKDKQNTDAMSSEFNKRCTSVRTNGKSHHHDITASRHGHTKHSPTNVGHNTTKRASTNSNRQANRNANQSQPSGRGPQSYSTRVSPSSKQPIHIIPLVPAPPTDDEEASSVYSCDTDGFYTSMHTDCGLYRLCNETTDGINEEEDENSEIYKGMFNDMMEAKQEAQQQNHNDKQSSPAISGLHTNRIVKKTSPPHRRQYEDHSGAILQASGSNILDKGSLEMYSSTSTLEENKFSPVDNSSKCSPDNSASIQQNGKKVAKPPPPPPPQRKDSLSSDTREVLLQIYMQMRNLSRLDPDQIRLNDKIIKDAMDEEHKVAMNTRRYSTGYNQSSAPSSIYDNHLGDQQESMSCDTNHGANNQPALRSSSQCSSSCVAPSTIMDSPSPSAGIASSSMRSVINDLKLSSMEALTSMPSDSNESLMMRQHKQHETNSSICDDDELDNDRSHYLSLKPQIETQNATSDKNCKQLPTAANNCNLSTLKRRSAKLPSILDQRPSLIMRKDHDVSDDKSNDNNAHTTGIKKGEHVKIAYKDIEKRKNTLKAMLKSLTNRTVSFRSKTMKQTPLSDDLTATQHEAHEKNDEDESSKPTESNQKEQDATTTAKLTEDEKPPEKQVESVHLRIESPTEALNGLSEETIENIVIDVDKEKEDEREESVFDEAKLNECKMRMLYPISRYQPNSTPNKTSPDSSQNFRRQSNASQYENEISNGVSPGAAPTLQSNDDDFCNSNTELDPIDLFNSWQANRSGHGRDPASVRTRLSSGSLADLGLARNRNSWSGGSSPSPCSSSPTTGPSSSPMSPHVTAASIMKQSPLNELHSDATGSSVAKSKLQQSNLNGSIPDIDNYIDDEDDDKEEHCVNSNGVAERGERYNQLSSVDRDDTNHLTNGIVNLAFNSNFIDEEEEEEEQEQQQQVSCITKDNSPSFHQSKQIRDYASLSLKNCNSFQGNLTKKPNCRKGININGTSMFAPSCEPISEEDPEESSDNNTGSNNGNRQSL